MSRACSIAFARAWEEASRAFQDTLAASSLKREVQRRGTVVTRKSPTMAGEKEGESWMQTAQLHRRGAHHQRSRDTSNALPAKPHPSCILCLRLLPETWRFVRAKHEVPPEGEAKGVCSPARFFRPRAVAGTDRYRHDLKGLCCSFGLLACLATKTLEQSFSRFSLNEEQST